MVAAPHNHRLEVGTTKRRAATRLGERRRVGVATPLGLEIFGLSTQGGSFVATLGFGAESRRWDSKKAIQNRYAFNVRSGI